MAREGRGLSASGAPARVTKADISELSEVLVRAFETDPILRWTFPGERSRRFWGRRFFEFELRRFISQDVSWTIGDRAGAALWALPGRWSERPADVVRAFFASGIGVLPRAPRVLRGLSQVEHSHPDGPPHLYLAVLGVEPGRQGLGLGSRLLAPGLELCDREGLPAYLETGKERNVAFYNRHGFVVRDELTLPKGPPIWFMWRDPR